MTRTTPCRGGFAVIGGIIGGCLVWAVASLAGLTALLAASTLAYDVVRIAGATYLVSMGAMMLWRTLPRQRRARPGQPDLAVLLWYPILIAVAARARRVLLRDRARAWCERLTAVVLVGVGVRLAAEAR